MPLAPGDKAPDFTLFSDQNNPVSLKDFLGKNIILYFYPKDLTPGCTQEACDFRDATPAFANQNTVILGISKDNPTRHQKFKQKYELPFTLLADINGDVCEQYGILNKKSLWGKTFLGIERSTFLIDSKGIIRFIWRKVKVNGHANEVQNELNKLN